MVAPLQTIAKNGYLYIYVSNESEQDVYFDDLNVKHYTGPLVQEQSYYPFGLQMAGISDKALNKLSSQYKFNGGVELEEEYGVNLYSTFYRQYDPQLGRFGGIDILSEQSHGLSTYQFGLNNPILFNDPLGDKASVSDFSNMGDLLNYLVNSAGMSTDAMFDFGDGNTIIFSENEESGFSAGFYDFALGFGLLPADGGGGGNGQPRYGAIYNSIIESAVRDKFLKKEYHAGLKLLANAYPDAFLPGNYWELDQQLFTGTAVFVTGEKNGKGVIAANQLYLDVFAKNPGSAISFEFIFRSFLCLG